MPASKPTEAAIMKMKKDELKEVITANNWLQHYKSSMLKSDMQVLALKSVGLGESLPMPVAKTPFKTPGRGSKTAGVTPKTGSTASPKVKSTPEVVAPPSTATRKSRRVAIKHGLAEADEPLPGTPTDESDSEDEEGEDAEPGSTGFPGPSAFWNAVDYVAAYWAFAVVILFVAVMIGYVVLESPMKDSIQQQYKVFEKFMLDKLDEAKKARAFL